MTNQINETYQKTNTQPEAGRIANQDLKPRELGEREMELEEQYLYSKSSVYSDDQVRWRWLVQVVEAVIAKRLSGTWLSYEDLFDIADKERLRFQDEDIDDGQIQSLLNLRCEEPEAIEVIGKFQIECRKVDGSMDDYDENSTEYRVTGHEENRKLWRSFVAHLRAHPITEEPFDEWMRLRTAARRVDKGSRRKAQADNKAGTDSISYKTDSMTSTTYATPEA